MKIKYLNKILPLALLIVALVWHYHLVLVKLFDQLITNDDFSYGLLIPIVSCYIVYQKWPKIKEGLWIPSRWGLLILGVALCFNIIGELAADLYVSRVSFVISLLGVVVLGGGWKLARLLSFPLLLLFLMIPLPDLITKALTIPLQLISSQLASEMLRFIGIPVLRQGNIIDLGVRQMQIVDACSGLRYILALLALGVIFCYFYQRKIWKIITLMIVLIPATIFANAVRVAAMGLYPALLEGFLHAFSGWLIFIFCFGILALVNAILNRLSPPEIPEMKEGASSGDKSTGEIIEPEKRTDLWKYVLAAVVMILIFIPITQRASYAPNYPMKEGFENFPMVFGTWKGHHVHIEPEMVAVTQSDAFLNAEYTNPAYGSVSLWIVYYETQKKGGGFVHSPKGCFISSGWEIEEAKTIEIADGKPVNWMLVNRMGEKLLVYYWFLQRGRWISDEIVNKFYMAYDGFRHRRTDGAMIRLITPVGGNLKAAQEKLTAFAAGLIPILPNYIPEITY